MSPADTLPILHYPDPRLHTVAKPVAAVARPAQVATAGASDTPAAR